MARFVYLVTLSRARRQTCLFSPGLSFSLTRLFLLLSLEQQNVSLEVNPDADIQTTKEQLVQKLALVEAASTSKNRSISSSNQNAMASFLCVLWTAWTMPKLLPSDLYLVHNGKPLDDDAVWMDYGIRSSNKNYTVSVQTRVRGGCFMISASVLCLLCTAVVGSPCTCGVSLIAVPFLLPLLFVLPLFCL